MNITIRSLPGLTLVLHLLVSTGLAAEASAHKLSEWKIGKVMFGEKISKAELKGKVVVLENWGVNCPPCVASLPHLAELDKKFRDKGLLIIGAESQGSSKDQIKPLIEKAKVEYTITAGAEGPIKFDTIPRVFVFAADGALVYDGYPAGNGFEKAISDSLQKVEASPKDEPVVAAGPMIASRTWTNSSGVEIIAAVKSADSSSVIFLMPNGKEVAYPLEKLSEDSRKTIVGTIKAKE